MMLSEADIDDLLINGDLIIEDDIKWRYKRGLSHLEFRVPVHNEFRGQSLNLELVGTKNAQLQRYSFALLLNKRRIRGLCPFERHINRHPTRERIGIPHKHKWSDHCQDSYVYLPDDITDVNNIEQTFEEFLTECNITHTGNFESPPPVQYAMPL